ncbi:MAG TPA: molybdopterin cofactor-binding domain-containing protein, partial [Dehalococcoidia bacterium]|nr:molybdopterin cofactor-binding domain-containing protein [Dehalococcoidia bacterium]
AVAAIDEETALEALELIRVDYEPLPAIFDPLAALEPGALLIHDDVPGNVCSRHIKAAGDVEEGFGQADHIREDTFHTESRVHAALEPHGAVALWNPSGSLTIWTPCQQPYELRSSLAANMGIAEERIRLIKPTIGGGFGGKIDPFAHQFAAAWLARVAGRPVKVVLSREEIFLGTCRDYNFVITLKIGAKKDGSITAREARGIIDVGAYRGAGWILSHITGYQLSLPYIIPNYRYEGIAVYTNKTMGAPLRGFGSPHLRFASEVQLDMLAEDLGLDPLDIRLKNAVYAGYPHPGKIRINSCGLREAIEAVAEGLGWREKGGKLPPGRGLGIACSSYNSGVRFMENAGGEAFIKIDQEGGVHLFSGATDIGQGTETVLCQMVAEVLGLGVEDIAITTDDTSIAPFDLGTFASGVTLRAGNAALKPAQDVKRQLLEVVAPRLEVGPEEIELRGGRVYARENPERGMSFREAIGLYGSAGRPMPVVGRGCYVAEADWTASILRDPAGAGNVSPAYAFMAQGAEVEVDRETGRVRVLRMVTAHDCGRVINPLFVEGQMDGSVAKGMGMALYEELPHEEGHCLSTSFRDYSVPTALDMPNEIVPIGIETEDPLGPFGAKEAGEGTATPTAAAIANAIRNATGIHATELPITPDKLLRALAEKEAKAPRMRPTALERSDQ